MKKLLLISSLCVVSQISFGQTNAVVKDRTGSNDPKYLEMKKQHDAVTAKSAVSIEAATYAGYNEQLKTLFKDGIISSATPKFDGVISKSDYLKILNDWISKNQHLIKPEQQNTLIK